MKENFSYIKTITAKKRHSRLHSHRYIFQYTAFYTCRIMLYFDEILERGDRGIKTSS